MARGNGQIIKTTVHGPYAYLWKGDATAQVFDDVVNSLSLANAYNGLGALFQAMAGTIKLGVITVFYDNGITAEAKIFLTAPTVYAYEWKADKTQEDLTGAPVTGQTLAQSFTAIATLATGLSGTIIRATMSGVSA